VAYKPTNKKLSTGLPVKTNNIFEQPLQKDTLKLSKGSNKLSANRLKSK